MPVQADSHGGELPARLSYPSILDPSGHREVPLLIGVLADLAGQNPEPPWFQDPRFLECRFHDFDRLFQRINPSLVVDVPDYLGTGAGTHHLSLSFTRIEDFEASSIAGTESFRGYFHSLSRLRKILQHPGRLKEALRGLLEDRPHPVVRSAMDQCLRSVDGEGEAEILHHLAMLAERLERRLSRQLDAVLERPEFQALAASWRGLYELARKAARDRKVEVRVLPLTKSELEEDLTLGGAAWRWERSFLLRWIHGHGGDVVGGTPYSCLAVGFSFDRSPEDMLLMERLAYLGAATRMPVVVSASPGFFGVRSWPLLKGRRLSPILDSPNPDGDRWRAFQDCRDASYMFLAVSDSPAHPATAPLQVAHAVIDDFLRDHWFQPDLALGALQPAEPDPEGLDFRLSPYQVAELRDSGFLTVSGARKPDPGNQEESRGAAPLDRGAGGTRAAITPWEGLARVLLESRIHAHAKGFIQEWFASTDEPRELERAMRQWLSQYVLLSAPHSSGTPSRYLFSGLDVKASGAPPHNSFRMDIAASPLHWPVETTPIRVAVRLETLGGAPTIITHDPAFPPWTGSPGPPPRSRLRPPRVHLTHDVVVDVSSSGEPELRREHLPFRVLVVADAAGATGREPRFRDRELLTLSSGDIDQIFRYLSPRIAVTVPSPDGGSSHVELDFRSMEDFHPDGIVRRHEPMASLLRVRRELKDLLCRLDSDPGLEAALDERWRVGETGMEASRVEEPSPGGAIERETSSLEDMIDSLVETGFPDAETGGRERQLVESFCEPFPGWSPEAIDGVRWAMESKMALLDGALSAQVSAILGHPGFRKLEAIWRGLEILSRSTRGAEDISLHLLPGTKDEVCADLTGSGSIQESKLWKTQVEEFAFGGRPYGLLLLAFEWGPDEMSVLEKLADLLAEVALPCVSAAGPALLGVDERFESLGDFPSFKLWFEREGLSRWRALRERETSRWLCLALPEVSLRPPYGPGSATSFTYHPWSPANVAVRGSAAWALGSIICRAQERFGWSASVMGLTTGGLFGEPYGVGSQGQGNRSGRLEPMGPLISSEVARYLATLGFAVFAQVGDAGAGAFLYTPSVYRLKEPWGPGAEQLVDLAMANTWFPYTLACAPILHHLMAQGRDAAPFLDAPADLVELFEKWLASYVLPGSSRTSLEGARRPLDGARVELSQDGILHVEIRPSFQLRLARPFSFSFEQRWYRVPKEERPSETDPENQEELEDGQA